MHNYTTVFRKQRTRSVKIDASGSFVSGYQGIDVETGMPGSDEKPDFNRSLI